jgi:tight adherence protein B
MTVLLAAVLAAAAWLMFGSDAGNGKRMLKALAEVKGSREFPKSGYRFPAKERPSHGAADNQALSLTILVHQLAALLRGGRSLPRLWEELWLVHAVTSTVPIGVHKPKGGGASFSRAARSLRPSVLSRGSLDVLTAVRAASQIGRPTGEAIRKAAARALPGQGNRERRIWGELAACFDVAETSGCPLAEILHRFAAQLEAEDDAEAARRTALAGPKATVRLLGWLPLLGLGLGMVLGVDPLGILLGSPFGVAALVAGITLTLSGRVWSARLVKAAAGDS